MAYGVGVPGYTAEVEAQSRAANGLNEFMDFVRTEVPRIINTGGVSRSKYSTSFSFEDPLISLNGMDSYSTFLRALHTLFDTRLELHSVQGAENRAEARWTMTIRPRFPPWPMPVVLTGRTTFVMDPTTGLVTSQKNSWDAVKEGQPGSLEAVQYLLQSLLNIELTPDLDSPRYKVLLKTKDYEIRRYDPYLVAEVAMGNREAPASGQGFMELADYIFGKNAEGAKMEMTTPVYTTSGGTPEGGPRMQFVMEPKYEKVEELPTPDKASVTRSTSQGGYVAARSFTGLPMQFEVDREERRLRESLVRDGYAPGQGYRLARYNEPFTLPNIRRNEVIISLPGFKWEEE